MTGDVTDLTGELAEIAEDFAALPVPERLQLLLQFSRDLPDLPPKYADHPELLEPIPECQSPIFVTSEVTGGTDGVVQLYFSAPQEAPTTRGFAGILHAGLSGRPVAEVMSVPEDLSLRLSLGEAVSPLRRNGMAGMVARIKRQVRDKSSAGGPGSARVHTPQRPEDRHAHPVQAGDAPARHPHHGQPSSG